MASDPVENKLANENLSTHSKKTWFRKYFMEGQALEESGRTEIDPNADSIERMLAKYRKYIAVILPVSVMMTFWLLTAIRYNWFVLYETHWKMPVVMIFGALVAGLTAESGGAVAFPIMTLLMHIQPKDARDFSLLVEANGMACGMMTVMSMKVQIEEKSILFGTIGSIAGLIIGFEHCDHWLTGPEKKMIFVSIWTAFAAALFLLNRQKKRKTFMTIPEFQPWKAEVLLATGFFGGILTAFTGSGVDICVFSIITILFRVSEKSATPTTIILMGTNAIVGAYYRLVWIGDVNPSILDDVKCSIPSVLLMVPVGSFIGSHFHRQVLAFLVYILEALALVGFFLTMPPISLIIWTVAIIAIGFAFFYALSQAGERLLLKVDDEIDDDDDVKKPLNEV